MTVKPGSMGKSFPGITATVLDMKTFEPINEPGKVGLIALKPGWPSMIRTYWNNPEGYKNKFKNGWYLTGDRSSIDKEGYFWFVGRDDDVINTGGHLVGPFEIESALLEHPAVAESAAVAKPDPTNMEVVKAFIALKPGFEPSDDLDLEIMNFIRKKLSPVGHAAGNRIREVAAQNALRQNHAPRFTRSGIRRTHRRHQHARKRLSTESTCRAAISRQSQEAHHQRPRARLGAKSEPVE